MGGSKQGHVSAVILSDARRLFSLTALVIFLMLIYIVIPGSGWGRTLEKIESVQVKKNVDSSYVSVRMLGVGKVIQATYSFCKAKFGTFCRQSWDLQTSLGWHRSSEPRNNENLALMKCNPPPPTYATFSYTIWPKNFLSIAVQNQLDTLDNHK